MKQDPREQMARKALRTKFNVEAIAWIDRYDGEFAAIVCGNENPPQYEAALEFLTDPRNTTLVVVREYVGKYDTRIYVRFAR